MYLVSTTTTTTINNNNNTNNSPQIPAMDENTLVLELEMYGVGMEGGTMEFARDKFMRFIKKSFGMDRSPVARMLELS